MSNKKTGPIKARKPAQSERSARPSADPSASKKSSSKGKSQRVSQRVKKSSKPRKLATKKSPGTRAQPARKLAVIKGNKIAPKPVKPPVGSPVVPKPPQRQRRKLARQKAPIKGRTSATRRPRARAAKRTLSVEPLVPSLPAVKPELQQPAVAPPVEPKSPPSPVFGSAVVPRTAAAPQHRKETAPSLKVPSYLLEGDQPTLPSQEQFGSRILRPPSPIREESAVPQPQPLPAAYGTGALYLLARDPRCLFAQWDLAPDEQRKLNAASADGHLVIRLNFSGATTPVLAEVHVHPESRHWFLQVPQPGAKYVAELGFYLLDRSWVSVARSEAAETPREGPAEDRTVLFGRMPLRSLTEMPSATTPTASPVEGEMPPPAPAAGLEGAHFPPLLQASERPARRQFKAGEKAEPIPVHPPPEWPRPEAKPEGYKGTPQVALAEQPAQAEPPQWTEQQEKLLYALLGTEIVWRGAGGSAEIAELVKRAGEARPAGELPSAVISSLAGPGLEQISAPTSPAGAPLPALPGAFWFNVNAELVVYGATEADAIVDIGGRRIRLRPDGTFSYRFALPDGKYELPISASSARTADRRLARLEFSRATEYRGEVGAHPQDANLSVASPDNVQ